MNGEDRTTPRCDDDFLVNVNGRTFTHKFAEGFAEPSKEAPMSDPTREALREWLNDPLRDYLDERDRAYLAALSTTPAPSEAREFAERAATLARNGPDDASGSAGCTVDDDCYLPDGHDGDHAPLNWYSEARETEALENDIRELRGAEPGELARRLIERGWTLAALSAPPSKEIPHDEPDR